MQKIKTTVSDWCCLWNYVFFSLSFLRLIASGWWWLCVPIFNVIICFVDKQLTANPHWKSWKYVSPQFERWSDLLSLFCAVLSAATVVAVETLSYTFFELSFHWFVECPTTFYWLWIEGLFVLAPWILIPVYTMDCVLLWIMIPFSFSPPLSFFCSMFCGHDIDSGVIHISFFHVAPPF